MNNKYLFSLIYGTNFSISVVISEVKGSGLCLYCLIVVSSVASFLTLVTTSGFEPIMDRRSTSSLCLRSVSLC